MNTKQPQSIYNASVVWTKDGKAMSVGAAQVNGAGQILTVAGISCAPGQNTPAFDAYYRSSAMAARLGAALEVRLDGGAAYRAKLAGMALPPAYRRA